MEDHRLRILIVDDEEPLRVPLQGKLQELGFLVDVAENGDAALTRVAAANGGYDVVVLDQSMIPPPDGITAMKHLRRDWPDIECLIMTGWDDVRNEALASGAFAYLEKPFDVRELALWLRSAAQAVFARHIQEAILSRQPADSVLRLIVDNLQALLQADQAAIVLHDAATGQLRVHDLPDNGRWTRHFHDRWLTREIMETREPTYLSDLTRESGLDERFVASGYRSLAAAPILLGARAEGVLYVYSKQPNHFDDGARSAVAAFARFAALAVGNLDMARQAEAYAAYTEALLALGRELVAAGEEEQLLALAWHFVRDTLQVNTFFVAFYDHITDTLWFPAAYDRNAAVSIPPRKLTDAGKSWGLAGHVVKRNKELSWQSNADKQQHVQVDGVLPVMMGDACSSCLCLPLLSADAPLGSLSIQAYREYAFSPAQIEGCRALARLLAPAIENVRRAAQQRKTARQLTALNDLTLRIAAEQEHEGLLRTVIEAALPLVAAEGGAIYLLEPSGDRFKLAASVPAGFGVDLTACNEGIRGLVLRTGAAQTIPEYHRWDERVPALDPLRLTSVAAAPIRLGERTLGTLNVHRTIENQPFTGEDLAVLQQVANHAGLALQKAQITQQSQELQRLSAVIAEWSDYQKVLNRVCQTGVDLFGADHSGLVLFDDDQQAGSVAAEWPPEVGALGLRIPLVGVPAEEQLIHDEKPIVIAKLDEAKDDLGSVYAILHNLSIQSTAIVSIIYQGRKLGSLSLDAIRQPRQFAEEEVEFMRRFAAQAAIAIANAQLHAESKQRGDLLSALDHAAQNVLAHQNDPDVLIHVARAAAEMLSCRIGCLLLNHRYIGQLEVVGVYHLPDELYHMRLPLSEAGFAGEVAQAVQHAHLSEPLAADRVQTIGAQTFSVCVGVPLSTGGGADYVLLLGECAHGNCLGPNELEVLARFASQSALLLRTASVLAPDRRAYAQLSLLHSIGEYMQQASDLDTIAAIALTGATAGYGLGFNRAAMFLLDERGRLVGQLGIGNLTEHQTYDAWNRDYESRLQSLDRFIERWKTGKIDETPIGMRIKGLTIPVEESGDLGRVLRSGCHERYAAGASWDLPQPFVDAFEPDGPMVIAPLGVGSKELGVLVVENKFTRIPVSDQLLDALLTLTTEAAVVIRNHQLHEGTCRHKERLQKFLETSSELVGAESPADQVGKTVQAALEASGADGISLIPLDRRGHVEKRNVVSRGIDDSEDAPAMVRPDGLSMNVLQGRMPYEKIEDADIERRQGRNVNPGAPWQRIRAALCLPLKVEGDNRGVMWFHYTRPQMFDERDINHYRIFVNQAALAYDAARRLRALDGMRAAAYRMADLTGSADTTQQIVDAAREVLDAQAVWFWRYDRLHDVFDSKSCVHSGLDDSAAAVVLRTPPRVGFTSSRILEQGAIEVEDVEDRQRYNFLDEERVAAFKDNGLYSFLGESLAFGDKKLGVLYIAYAAPRTFTQWEKRMAASFSYQAALAISNVELMAGQRQAKESAGTVIKMSTLGELRQVMESVAQEFIQALHCDTVTVYSYDADRKQFDFPPATIGLRAPEGVRALRYVEQKSAVGRVMALDEAHLATDARSDPIFNQGAFLGREDVHSSVGAPLRAREGKVGVVFLGYRNAHKFTDEDKETVQLLADTAAIAIGNAQLYQRTQDDAHMREAILKAGRVIGQAKSLDAALKKIVRQALKLARMEGTEGAFAHVSLKFGRWLRFMEASDPVLVRQWRTTLGDIDLTSEQIGLTGQVALSGVGRNIPDVEAYQGHGGPYLVLHKDTHSELCVAVARGARTFGIINLEHPEKFAFDDRLLRTMQILADQAAIAVERVLLVRRLRIVSDISRDSAQLLELKPFMECLFGRLAGEFRRRRTPVYPSLATYDPQSGQIATHLTRYYTRVPRTEYRTPEDPGIIPLVVRTGQPYYAPDVNAPAVPYQSYRSGTKAEIAVPIHFGDQLLGVLDIESTVPDPFEQEDIDFMKQLANQIATHLHAIQQYQQLNAQKQQLAAQAAVTWIGMVGSVFRHSVKNDAVTIRDNVQLIRQSVPATSHAQVAQRLSTIDLLANAIIDAGLSIPTSRDNEAQLIPINAFISERLRRLWDSEPYQSHDKEVDLHIDEQACVRASKEWLRLPFEIVLHNAVKAMADDPRGKVTVTGRTIGDRVEILITDCGPGIPEGTRPSLFKEPIEKAADEPGMGLGLLLAAMILELYKGKIETQQTGATGTTIRILLPLVDTTPRSEVPL